MGFLIDIDAHFGSLEGDQAKEETKGTSLQISSTPGAQSLIKMPEFGILVPATLRIPYRITLQGGRMRLTARFEVSSIRQHILVLRSPSSMTPRMSNSVSMLRDNIDK